MAALQSTLYCTSCEEEHKIFLPTKIEYPNISIPNRGFAWSLAAKPETATEVTQIKNSIHEYNNYIDKLYQVQGFWHLFAQNGYVLSREQIRNSFGNDVEAIAFSLKKYPFETELCVQDELLFLADYEPTVSVIIPDGQSISFCIGRTESGYPTKLSDGRILIWNWVSQDKDFTFYLWEIFDELGILPAEDAEEPVKSYDKFNFWDQARYDTEPDKNLLRCMKTLVDMGYASKYEIKSDHNCPWMKMRGYGEGLIGLCVIDPSFKKNRMVVERLKILLALPENKIDTLKYFLTSANNEQYLSKDPGTIGGHCKLKIYGKLDCPSALRHISNGNYVQHRVFFAEQRIAEQAGYRPCAKCMRDAYMQWKSKN